MATPPPELRIPDERLHALILATAQDIGALLADADPGVRVPSSVWTLGEAAAHLALANELMADLAAGAERPYGDGTPGGLAAANAESLARFPERTPGVLGAAVVEHARAFVSASVAAAGDAGDAGDAGRVLGTPMGEMDLATLGSYLLTHMLGHGWDLARALRRPHMISRQRAELCLPFLVAAMPRVVDPVAVGGLNARYTIGVRGGQRFSAVFESGALTVTPGTAHRPDCTIITEPVTFLLIALGRCSPWGAIGRGRISAWGRRPLLAPAFPTYFRAP
ncbi:maleylpyruvate isomerase family mycothiol-dependent enzyme [Streptacidiphilus sp. PB12-B1b]|uniref:maleylpyruvate isomerase family mycothiol-dependent enzyme n=1 Tax=Streptacidiphilus sp. PB12-B1b TaxID=2705012 RepID=UPI0015FD26D4|nr:maleylpyruvate isomerase family mycothiol-dependent enzyme [Streptacidiphilus sp. PB12-B1b]QMU74561.1 maleylpyruvate isomerase family mycothiol-dependent enzyme [Streptacidiphilus sp. PB12-B1b]